MNTQAEPICILGEFYCIKCKEKLKRNLEVLTSDPPQYKYVCTTENCNYTFTSTRLGNFDQFAFSRHFITDNIGGDIVKLTNINDLNGVSLAYACCAAKGFNIKFVNYTDLFGVEEDNKIFDFNSRKQFKLSFVLPHLKKLNAVTFKLDSGWLAETNCGTIFTAQTFFEVVAKAFVFIKLNKSSISVPIKVAESTEHVDIRYFCAEDEF